MAYIKRNIEKTIEKIRYSYPEIYIGGQRQVGKSTTIKMIMGQEYHHVNLRKSVDRILANTNPRLFFEQYAPPLFIDEIHLAPVLLEEMMVLSDNFVFNNLQANARAKNLFFISSSAQLHAIKDINESSAGRVAILEMAGFSMQELDGNNFGAFVVDFASLAARKAPHKTKEEIFAHIFRGSMPKIVADHEDREIYYESYISSYINKDLREIADLQKSDDFYRFLHYIAARTACQIDSTAISRAIGVTTTTIKKWFSILENTGIIKFLSPFMANTSARIIKSKKMYFIDTGLCLYLLGFSTPTMVMKNSLISGAIFETFVVSEIIKSYYNDGKKYDNQLFYYRDTNNKEIDLIYYANNTLTPIEIKKNETPSNPTKNFNALKIYNLPINRGIVICNGNHVRHVNDDYFEFPVSLL